MSNSLIDLNGYTLDLSQIVYIGPIQQISVPYFIFMIGTKEFRWQDPDKVLRDNLYEHWYDYKRFGDIDEKC